RHLGVQSRLPGVHETALLPPGCLVFSRRARALGEAREVVRWVRGTTASYAWATPAGLSRVGSNKPLIASVLVVFGSRRAMTAPLLPLRSDVVRLHHRQRCAQKPSPIAGSKLCTRDAHRELYDMFCNIVGSVLSPILANVYLHYV